MNQEKINKYQDVYRQLWEIQMKKDRKEERSQSKPKA